jgi:hypothetical protein
LPLLLAAARRLLACCVEQAAAAWDTAVILVHHLLVVAVCRWRSQVAAGAGTGCLARGAGWLFAGGIETPGGCGGRLAVRPLRMSERQ